MIFIVIEEEKNYKNPISWNTESFFELIGLTLHMQHKSKDTYG